MAAEDKIAVPSGSVEGAGIDAIEGIRAAASPVIHDMSAYGMFMQADWVVKLVIIMLIASSVWSWKIIFEKYVRFRDVNKRMKDFEAEVWSGEPLERKYDELKNDARSPIERVFVAGMYEWISAMKSKQKGATKTKGDDRQLAMAIDPPESKLNLKMGIKERVEQAMESTRNREMSKLEQHLGFLATTGSAAPFVGLFGTVWGIMRSFQAIAMTQNTTLAVVAPGIAEALFATAIGLFAAIPAVIFYNKFANQSSDFADRVDGFIDEFTAVIGRELDKQE